MWKQFHPKYEISDSGQIRHIKHKKIRKLKLQNYGYQVFMTGNKMWTVHRLVATTFIDNPLNLPVVDHIDRNKTNNHVSNLRWSTQRSNLANRTHCKSCTC